MNVRFFLFSFPSISGRYNKQLIPYFGSEWRSLITVSFQVLQLVAGILLEKQVIVVCPNLVNKSYFFGSLIISCLVFCI